MKMAEVMTFMSLVEQTSVSHADLPSAVRAFDASADSTSCLQEHSSVGHWSVLAASDY